MENEKRRKSNTSGCLIVGVLVLIVLLIIWLTIADFFGDTDVAAQAISPAIDTFKHLTA